MDDCTCPSQNMHTFAELERLATQTSEDPFMCSESAFGI